MEIVLSPKALEQIEFWKKTGNKQVLIRIEKLLDSILETPFNGIGKPEALKHSLSGYWSRRINQEHRIVYKIENDLLYILTLKDHY